MAQKTLQAAKDNKNDEFYTQLPDIEHEVHRYASQLKGKVIFCNCDDPAFSNFFYHFCAKFKEYGIKKLITTHYSASAPSYKIIVNTPRLADEIVDHKGMFDFASAAYIEKLKETDILTPLKGNGDFRSPECIALLKKSDVMITNPPFSLFREYIAQLVEFGKEFLIIGNMNAITYKDVFPLIKQNKMWVGYKNLGTDMRFFVPDHYEKLVNVVGEKDGKKIARSAAIWYTNLAVSKRNEELDLYKRYTPAEYPHYDNYHAIEVSKVAEIPMDYDGYMGVPISFLDKHNPKQFEIIGQTGVIDPEDVLIEYKGGRPYINGKRLYTRILIRKRKA